MPAVDVASRILRKQRTDLEYDDTKLFKVLNPILMLNLLFCSADICFILRFWMNKNWPLSLVATPKIMERALAGGGGGGGAKQSSDLLPSRQGSHCNAWKAFPPP